MTDLTGLPDFSNVIASTAATMIAPFGGESYSVLPQDLQLAANADGSPKFELDLVQNLGDLSASGQYAELDFSIAGNFPLDAALSQARTTSPAATVKPITMDGGFGRLYATASAGTIPLPADMLTPVPLGWWSEDLARWTIRTSRDAGELIKGALSGQSSLLLGARVEASVPGVAPRLPVYAQFNPTTLLTSLLASHADRSIAVAEIFSFFFSAPLSQYPVTLTTVPGGSQASLAQIMTDRVVAAYASLTPSPGIADSAFVQFGPIDQIDTAATRWDLNEPTLVMRPWIFTLDPFSSIRALNNAAVLASLVKEITVPALSIGLYHVDLTASLPPSRVGISALGVRVELPPSPPARPFSISKTALFTPPGDSGSVDLTLGADETLEYAVTCFGVIAAGDFVQQYESAPQNHNETWVQLSAGDFPLNFAHVIASSRLLNLANIVGALSYQVGDRTVQQSFKLSAGSPDIAVAAPTTATACSIALQAVPLDGGAPLAPPAMALGQIQLDVNSFAGYGPHTVTVGCHLAAGDAPLFIEFIPELQAANSQAIPGKVALTSEQPSANWGYVAISPFHPGYCFRVAAAPGNPPVSWSVPRSSDAPLTLDLNGAVIPDSGLTSSNTSSPGAPVAGASDSDPVPSLVS
jgi:hypothetical protein